MPIDMPRGLPFSVDTWSPYSKKKRHSFLTHAHKDHSQGILTNASFPIYCSLLTKSLVLKYYPQLDEGFFVEIEVGQTIVINDSNGDFKVTAFDANHCPGALMFLFEGRFGKILHTGDCRLTPECLQKLPEKFLRKKGTDPSCLLDYVFLDCTFGGSQLRMPSRQSAIQQVINCIWKHPDAPRVYLTCDLLGQEEILVHVSQTFGCKIYVDKVKNPECYKALEIIVPDILTQDSSSRFHLFDGFPKLYERAEVKIAEARANFQHEPLIIRPSAQWYACEDGVTEAENRRKGKCDQPVRDTSGVWHVCYSMHSSKEELEWALQLLAPKWVVSTTPSCRAMELAYFKKHCLNTRRTSDDSLWKLMNLNVEDSPAIDTSVNHFSCSPSTETTMGIDSEPLSQPIGTSRSRRMLFNLSSPKSKSSITLFGKARTSFQDSIDEGEIVMKGNNSNNSLQRGTEVASLSPVEVVKVERMKPFEETREVEGETKSKSMESRKRAYDSSFGSSNSYSDSLRNFYRSMNVPVPQPLPPLVALMKAIKNTKRRL